MTIKRYELTQKDLDSGITDIIQVLSDGGLVVFPSDTVYGLLVDATNPRAVDKLIAFKDRPPGKAISVFVSGFEMMQEIVELGEPEERRLRELLPGSYTIVLPSLGKVDPRLESETRTLGVRYISFDPAQRLVSAFRGPITATSANLGGASPHYSIDSFLRNLPKEKEQYLDLVIDFGKLPRNAPSTVIDYTGSELTTLRLGDSALAESRSYITRSPEETQQIAGVITKKLLEQRTISRSARHIVCLLQGDLGAGKTQFTKGVARALGVESDIISPTFVVYYEYRVPQAHQTDTDTDTDTSTSAAGAQMCASVLDVPQQEAEEVPPIQNLYHFDLYNIQQPEELNHLGLDEIREHPAFFCIEWGERLGKAYDIVSQDAEVVFIEIEHVMEDATSQTRKIRVVPVQT